MTRRAPALVVSFAFLVTAAIPAARADEILLFQGEARVGVTVLEESCEAVTFRQKGIPQPQTLPAALVKSVAYERKSKGYQLALDALDALDLPKAADLFLAASRNAKNWEKQYALFQRAECLRRQGASQLDAAIEAYRALLADVPNTRFLGDCWLRIVDCQEQQGRLDAAKQSCEQLRKEVATKHLAERFELLADFRRAALSEAGSPDVALATFEELQRRAAGRPELADVANLARLRAGRAWLAKGDIAKARRCFDDAIQDREASDAETAAGAYNGLGRSYVAGPRDPTDDDFNHALFPFFRTIFHYGEALGTSDLVAEALYWGGRCLEARGGANDVKRARQLYERCKKEYPSSPWARLAAQR